MKSDPQPDLPELCAKWELSPDVRNKLEMLVKLLHKQEELERLGLRLPRVLLFGNAGVDKMEIAAALSAASGKPLVAAHARELKSRVKGESSVAIRKLFERAHAQAPCVLFIQDIDLIASKRGSPSNDEHSVEIMNELLLQLVPAPQRQVLLAASADNPDNLDSAVHLRFQIKIDLCLPWQSLVLRPSVKEQLLGVLRSIQSNAQGFNTLISGPPGTGKSAVIRDLAKSSGLRFLSAGPLDLRGGFVGQTEMRVKAAFDKARNSAPVIFFIDLEQGPYSDNCLLPPRGSSESDSVTHELVCAVLAQMDSLRGKHPQVFIICETFDIDRVDPAVVSRFDVRIELPLPDEAERRLIVEQMLRNSGFSADFDVNEISARIARSLPRASGRDLDHCIRAAIQHATQRSSNGETVQLTTSDLISTAGENTKNVQIEIIQGNITTLPVDAIVNAANSSLLGGGGVDGAIHNAAGPQLFEECRTLGGCATGEAKITKGYRLPAKFIIHTVGPVYQGTPEDAQLLANCYRNSLRIANERRLKSIAFPSISTGAFGYPLYEACRIALRTTREMFESGPMTLERVVFVTFSYTDCRQYEDAYKQILADT